MVDYTFFDYATSDIEIRSDLADSFNVYWRQLSAAGTWFTASERIAIAAESRAAFNCALCRRRKNVLSPNSITGTHTAVTDLPPVMVEAIHKIVTDQARITESYVTELRESGLSEAAYVELVGITVTVFSIDEFHRAIGLPLEALPEPSDTLSPSRYSPPQATHGTGFVAMLPSDGAVGHEEDLWINRTANVHRALSLVPNAVREWVAVMKAQYMSMTDIATMQQEFDRSLSRAQMEIVAARVSSYNDCFY